jgi:autotransporter-associated beta strand protein
MPPHTAVAANPTSNARARKKVAAIIAKFHRPQVIPSPTTHNPFFIALKPLKSDPRGFARQFFSVCTATPLILCFSHHSQAADVTWKNSPAVGNFHTPTHWDPEIIPGTSDVAKINNSGETTGATSVNFVAGDSHTLTTLDLGAANQNFNRPIFNQTGGELTVANLFLGHANYGGTKSPEYHLQGGTLNITTSWTLGNGSAIKFLASGGTLNHTGAQVTFGNQGVAHELTLSNDAVMNYAVGTGDKQFTLGTTSNSVGKMTLSGSARFEAPTLSLFRMGNTASRGNFVTLQDQATFHAPLATVALAQWNDNNPTLPTVAAGTINLSGNSTFTAKLIKTGGNNAANPQWGVIQLDGGTLATEGIAIGSSSTPADINHNVVHANGGTIQALVESSNFFSSVFVNLQAGGLTFDTGDNWVTITNPLSGSGGLTKTGAGVLTLTQDSLTYTGETHVKEGTLAVTSATFADDATIRIEGGDVAKLELLNGIEDQVGTLILNGVTMPAGTYGSYGSGADNVDEFHFAGTGWLRVGASTYVPRNLVWDGNEESSRIWEANPATTAFLEGETLTHFNTFDNVSFGDLENDDEWVDRRDILILGTVQPTQITFNNSPGFDYRLEGGTIAGTTGIIKNGGGSVTLSSTNTFYGPIQVNAGKLIAGVARGFGNTSGISLGAGAQVDLNGKAPTSGYTYNLAGPGPDGSGSIINTGGGLIGNSGIKNLVLSADSTIGNDTHRFDICQGGTLTGNGHTLIKVGNNGIAFRGNAGGSPIQIVAAAGSIWAEGVDAFGGATGNLVVKSGARAGSYGTREITTPTTLEDGSMLNNLGNGAGTWSAPLTVAGQVVLEAGSTAADQIHLTGTITGAANFTKQGTATVTISHPSHTGDTTVAAGTLSLANPELNDAGNVTIAATAVLNLDYDATDTVKSLTIGTTVMAPGVYGAGDTDRITGPGKLRVGDPPAQGSFDAWAAEHITDPENASLRGKQDDPDHDGFSNLEEFLFGTDPEASTATLTEVTQSGSGLIVRWIQRDSGASYLLQQGTTLAETPWPASDVTPTNAPDQSAVLTGYTRKQALIPIDAAARKFVRVQATEN